MKKKIFYILAIIFASALIVTGVVFLFFINWGVRKPEAVTISTSNAKTYIKTTLNDNQYGYIYKFINGEEEILFESTNNLICADNLIEDGTLKLGTTYTISVCYKNEYENGYSNFSQETTWLASQFLSTPSIFVLPGFEYGSYDEMIIWDEIQNADKYILYYSLGDQVKTYETTETYLELKEIEGGEHTFYVMAKSDKQEYIDSDISNKVTAKSCHEVQQFISARFQVSSKKLIINSHEDVSNISIWLGTNENDAQRHNYSYQDGGTIFTKKTTEQGYQFTINISAIYNSEMTYIALKPNVSGHNSYNGGFTVAEFE